MPGSRPSNWSEDLLLPRLWDARGHARGILAPGGWIARCDPDGQDIELGPGDMVDVPAGVEHAAAVIGTAVVVSLDGVRWG